MDSHHGLQAQDQYPALKEELDKGGDLGGSVWTDT